MAFTGAQRRVWAHGIVAVVITVVATPAVAQEGGSAEAVFARGVREMMAGRYREACPLIAQSLELDPQPGALFTLAQCEDKGGRSATALVYYRQYLELLEAMPPERQMAHRQRAEIARARVEVLQGEVSFLTLLLPHEAPDGLVIRRNGVVVPATAIGSPAPVDPGEQVVTAQVPGGRERQKRLRLGKGERQSVIVDIDVQAREPPPAATAVSGTTPTLSAGPSAQRAAAYAVGGLGVAGLLIGSVSGAVALAKKATVDAACGVDGVASRCHSEASANAGNSARTAALVSTVGFAAGGAALGTAVILWFTDERSRSGRGTGPRPTVLQAGPEAAVIGIRGTW